MTILAHAICFDIKARKTWAYAVVSAVIALFVMLMFYLHWCPKSDVTLQFETAGYSNQASNGTEFRIYYIMADDMYLPLKEYAANGFIYDGTLYTYGSDSKKLTLTVEANRFVEVSLKKGQWMTNGQVRVGMQYQSVDFYSETDGQQHLMLDKVHNFIRPISLALGLIMFALAFAGQYFLFGRHKSEYWNSPPQFTEIFICAVLIIFAALFGWDSYLAPRARAGVLYPDAAIAIANTQSLLAGKIPYVDFHDEKGAFLNIILAFGQAIWFPHGIWLLEIALCLVAVAFLYLALRTRDRRIIALPAVVVAILIANHSNVGGVNTEVLSLPFICAAFYVFMRLQTGDSVKKRWLIVCGACFSIVLFIRINNAALWVAYVPLVFLYEFRLKGFKQAFHHLIYMGVGAVVIMILYFGWLGIVGGLGGYFDSAVFYAKYYISNKSLFAKSMTGFEMILESNVKHVFFVPFCVLAFDIYDVINKHGQRSSFEVLSRWVSVVLCFAIATLSGYKFQHYMLILLPIYADFASAFIGYIHKLAAIVFVKNGEQVFVLIMSILLFACGQMPFAEMWGHVLRDNKYIPDGDVRYAQVANYIESNTMPDESFTVYNTNSRGAAIQNLHHNRYADGFVFVSFVNNLYNNMQADDFLSVVKQNNKFFVNAMDSSLPSDVAEYITKNYARVESIDQVEVYEYVDR
jgi:hypothetical protein